jgi:hypothetical protein
MTSPADSNRNERWWTANSKIPTQRRGAVGFLRLKAEEDVNNSGESAKRVRGDCHRVVGFLPSLNRWVSLLLCCEASEN